jgi:hypothetical protein
MSIFSSIISGIISVVKLVKEKAIFTDIAMNLIVQLPQMILDMIAANKLDTEAKLDEALEELDLRTGMDAGALDVVRNLPADKEEDLFDHLKGIIQILGKHKLKVEGYYIEPAPDETLT